jgi:hypothetical protein
MAFLPFFAFAFTLGPLAISIQVALFFTVKALLFLEELQAFFIC